MKTTFIHSLFVGSILCLCSIGSASQFSLDLGAGMSKQSDEEADSWETGYDVAADGFIYVSDKLGFGARVALNRWDIKKSEFEKQVADFLNLDITGTTTVIEVLPSARVRTSMAGPLNFFGQIGLGLYIVDVEARASGLLNNASTTVIFDDGEMEGKFGGSIGAGLALGNWENFNFQVYPMYHLVSQEDHALQYFTVNAGIMFGM